MRRVVIALIISLFVLGFSSLAFGQLSIGSTGTDYIIDFDGSVTDVNNGQYAGAGFVPSPTSGQLDSDAWATSGMDDGDSDFGASNTSGDFARGSSSGGVTTGGFYAFQVETDNYAFGIQPADKDWTPGTVVLRIQNNTASTLTTLNISYKIWVYNDADRANSFNFSHSSGNSTWTDVEALNYTSEEAASGSPAWESIEKSTTLSVTISPGGYYYLRWEGDDVSGSDNRDEFGLDDIVISGSGITGGVADPKNFTATPVSTSQIDLSWTKNDNNDNVMVAWNSSNTFGTPADGTSYSEGDLIPGGGTVLYNGSGTSYSHTSLDPNTQYFYKAWSVDVSAYYSSGVTADATTHKEEPTNHVTDFTATAEGWSKIDLSWAENDGSVVPDGYLIKASTLDNVTAPTDGIPVADNTTIGDNSGAINLTHGTTTYQWTGLNAESTYYFKIYPYTNSGLAIDYKTDEPVPSAYATTGAMPEIPNLMLSEMCDPKSNYQNDRFIEIYNTGEVDVDLTDWSVVAVGNDSEIHTWNLSGTIAAGDALVCGDATTTIVFDVDFPDETWSEHNSTWNGESNDGAKLYYNGTLVDNAVVDTTRIFADKTLVRNPDISVPSTTFTASEWTAIPADSATDATPGSHPLPNIWINEFHYDNDGTDTGEFVEVVVPADFTGLSEITLTLYNGSDSTTYGSHKLDGFTTDGDIYANFKIYYKGISDIQNGSPDGFSLDYGSLVIQFLSYEGTFTAVGGPADSLTSTDIEVSESDSTPVGYSLQLMGNGTQYSDFTWAGPYPQTKGTPNSDNAGNDQTLPVTLISFTATPGNAKVTLNWITESEVENLGFNIYRSLSGEQFSIINDQLIPGHGNTSSRHEYQYVDKDVVNGVEYFYQLEDVSYNGKTEKHSIVSAIPSGNEELGMIPADFQLFPCYPNPFNPSTTIRFNIPEECYVTLKVYDLLGNLVITLIDQNLLQNQYNITWNGKDAKNLLVANGVYFYQLTTDRGFTSTKKMIFLR